MTSQEIAALVGAAVALLTALQGWLIARSVKHENAINGVMSARITDGANAAIAADQKMSAAGLVAPLAAQNAARIAELERELLVARAIVSPPPTP